MRDATQPFQVSMQVHFKPESTMYKRRTVIKSLGYAAVGVALGADSGFSRALVSAGPEFVTKRPAVGQRKLVSDAVEAKITEVRKV